MVGHPFRIGVEITGWIPDRVPFPGHGVLNGTFAGIDCHVEQYFRWFFNSPRSGRRSPDLRPLVPFSTTPFSEVRRRHRSYRNQRHQAEDRNCLPTRQGIVVGLPRFVAPFGWLGMHVAQGTDRRLQRIVVVNRRLHQLLLLAPNRKYDVFRRAYDRIMVGGP